MAPTAAWMIESRTFSVESFASASARASTEPCTSPLMMTRSSCWPLSAMRFESSSSETFAVAGMRLFAILPLRLSAISWAFFASFTASMRSPALGTSLRPRISTGVAGPRLVELLAVLVGHRADLAEAGAGEDEVAHAQRAVLHEDAGDRAAAAIEQRLEHRAARRRGFGVRA